MAVQPWAEHYRTGIERIDRHHDDLFALMDEAFTAIIARSPSDVIKAKVSVIITQTLDHFTEEEREMQRAGIDGTAHLASHNALRDQLTSLTERLAAGTAVSSEVLDVMNQYLTQHIRVHDARLAKQLGS